jgi:hypothetical protein
MQFQVPQFIDIEDKIIGPFTLKQFLYLAAGFGLIFSLYFVLKFFIWLIFAIIIAAISVALAFVKINGRPFIKIITSMMNFYLKPQIYVWQPEKPNIPKTEESLKQNVSVDLIASVEKIISGISLKKAADQVLVGTSPNTPKVQRSFENTKERYEIFRKISGERKAARRVDYR